MNDEDSLFTWRNGVPRYRGLRVDHRSVHIADHTFRLAALKDAADLLDDAHFAKQFLEQDRAPYGMELWPAAAMLAEHIMIGEPGAGRSALELGCGLGLVSIAAQSHGWAIVASDNEAESLRFAAYNAALNEITLQGYRLLDWNAPAQDQRFDRVFGADLLYDRANVIPILRCLRQIMSSGGSALLADPNRSVADDFGSLALDHSFRVHTRAASIQCPDRGLVHGRIFALTL